MKKQKVKVGMKNFISQNQQAVESLLHTVDQYN